tara:strand:+ start:287 stop:1297 length:1011 start_codon:yes stop_codon:yes gene_type:complete
MPAMNMIQAVNSALDSCLEKNDKVCIFGEDVGYFGGVFRCTDGLQKKYGTHRVFDTPLSEGGIVSIAIGMGINGLRPVAEIQFSDYIWPAFDQITNELAKLRYRSAGEYWAPVTIRTPCGGGIKGGHYHSQSPEAYFTQTPGLKVVMPSNPYDIKGLLISSIEDDDPVIFFEPKRLYNGPFDGDHTASLSKWDDHPKGDVPDDYYKIPIGKASVVQSGSDVTVLAWGTMVHVAQAAINDSPVDAELIDLRTLVPLDIEAIVSSVSKTGRCIIIHEAPFTGGYGGEVSSLVQERCFYHLQSPIKRVTGWDTPFPHTLEWSYLPSQERIKDALEESME